MPCDSYKWKRLWQPSRIRRHALSISQTWIGDEATVCEVISSVRHAKLMDLDLMLRVTGSKLLLGRIVVVFTSPVIASCMIQGEQCIANNFIYSCLSVASFQIRQSYVRRVISEPAPPLSTH